MPAVTATGAAASDYCFCRPSSVGLRTMLGSLGAIGSDRVEGGLR